MGQIQPARHCLDLVMCGSVLDLSEPFGVSMSSLSHLSLGCAVLICPVLARLKPRLHWNIISIAGDSLLFSRLPRYGSSSISMNSLADIVFRGLISIYRV